MANGLKLEKKPVDFNALSQMLGGNGLTDEEKVALGVTDAEPEDVAEEAPEVDEVDELEQADDESADDVEDGEQETAVEEAVEEEPVAQDTTTKQPETKKPSKNLTPEQRRIIELKSVEKELRKQLAEFESKQKIEQFTEEYGKTTDADTAKLFAQSRLMLEQSMEKAALSEFKVDNYAILYKYNAMEDAKTIMDACAKADMTVEEYCRGKYGASEPIEIARGKAAARGQLPSTANKADYAVANASKASSDKKSISLSNDEKRLKERLASMGFKDLTTEEIKRTRHGL